MDYRCRGKARLMFAVLFAAFLFGRGTESTTTSSPSGSNRCNNDSASFMCNATTSEGFCSVVGNNIKLPQLNIANDTRPKYTRLLEPQTWPRCWNNSEGFECCLDPCKPNSPCYNDAVCKIGNGTTSFVCDCPDGVNGSHCEVDHRCEHTCHPNGWCNEKKCRCDTGFQGDGISCTAECDYEKVKNVDALTKCGFDSVTFHRRVAGLSQNSAEKCRNGRVKAIVECKLVEDGLARFDYNTLSCVSCDKTISSAVNETIPENVTVDDVGNRLKALHILSTEPNKTTAVVKDTVNYMTKLSVSLDTKDSGEKIDEQSMKAVLNVISNVGVSSAANETEENDGGEKAETVTEKEATRNSISQATTLIDSFARKVDLGNETEMETATTAMTLKVNRLVIKESNLTSMVIEPASYNEETTDEGETIVIKKSIVRIVTPSAMLKMLRQLAEEAGALPLTLVTVVYSDTSVITEGDKERPTSQLVQINYKSGERTEKTDLGGESFNIEFDDEPQPTPTQMKRVTGKLKDIRRNPFCVFYDFAKGKWSDDGCTRFVNATKTYCKCNHLTSFALLLRVTEVLQPYAFDTVSEIYSLFACGLSAVCLFATILIYVLIKDLRNRRPTPILVNICLCLAIGYIVFIVGMDGRSKGFQESACYASAVLMHISFLCAWFWMLIYSLNIYYALVKVVGIQSFVGKKPFMYLFGYGIPILLVAVNLGGTLYLDDLPKSVDTLDFESHYIASHICWIRNKSLYYGFALPVGVILLINMVFFFVILRKLTWKRDEVQSSKEAITVKQQIYMAITMIAMMGLTWVLGYIMLISDDEDYQKVMTIVFNVVNTSQGLVIFWVSCLRQKAVRQLWLEPFLNRFCCAGRRGQRKTGKFLYEGSLSTMSTGAYSMRSQDTKV